MYKYKAIQAGVLSNPYRHVKAGQVVLFDQPLQVKASWLVPLEEYRTPQELPIMGHMNPAGAEVVHITHPPAPIPESYKQQMEIVKALEAKQDGTANPKASKKKSNTSDSAQPEPDEDGEEIGTGDQDVLD